MVYRGIVASLLQQGLNVSQNGIDALALLRAVEDLAGTSLGIEEADLEAAPTPSATQDTSKAEAL